LYCGKSDISEDVFMKQYFCIITTVLLLLLLPGCAQASDTPPLNMRTITSDASSTELMILSSDPPTTGMTAVEVGRDFSFAIDAYGGLWVWGNNESARLGVGTRTTRERSPNPDVFDHFIGEIIDNNNKMSPVKIMTDVVSVSAGSMNAMAITTDGSLWAWGFGIFGDGYVRTSAYSPVRVMEDVVSVSAGFGHTMAITTDGSLWAWGNNIEGELGNGTGGHNRYSKYTPIKIMTDVVSVSAGFGHTMAITTDGSLWAWGWNSFGQLGDGTQGENRHSPVKVMDNVVSVTAGLYHTMAIRTDGSLWGWGVNWSGEIGDGTIDRREWSEEEGFWFFRNRPTPVKVMESVVSVSVADRHTMAITTDGTLWAWGDVYGIGPNRIMDSVSMVSTADHTIALQTDGSVWSWGRNDSGQLGDGTTTNRPHYNPVQIIGGSEI
jgi:alpha-tubulin suppressor-like RCC1 family protein